MRKILQHLSFPKAGFWLLCAWTYGVFGAIFIPRLSAGDILVNPIGIGQYGFSLIPVQLSPTTGNLTQSIYFTGDLACFLCCSVVASTSKGARLLTLSLLAYCVGDILMAFADLITYNTGTVYLLSFIRNANYTIFVESEGAASKRIIGSFTEASSFAATTVGVFGFSGQFWLQGVRSRLTLMLSLTALALLLFSTSSTAYVSLPFCSVILYARSCYCIIKKISSQNMIGFVIVFPLLLAAMILAIRLHTPTYAAVKELLYVMIFDKSSSDSGVDRGRTNEEAWASFLDSFGFGLGIGSVRASSFALAVAANLGLIGGAAYLAFISTALWGMGSDDLAVKAAARMACLCLLVAACVSGALIDLGLPFFMFAALAASDSGRQTIVRLGSPAYDWVAQATHVGEHRRVNLR